MDNLLVLFFNTKCKFNIMHVFINNRRKPSILRILNEIAVKARSLKELMYFFVLCENNSLYP